MKNRSHSPMQVRDFRSAERALKTGGKLTEQQMATAIENSPGVPLPPLLRNYLVGLLRGKGRLPRGRRRKDDGIIWEMTIAEAKRLHRHWRAKYRTEDKTKRAEARANKTVLPRAEMAPYERALHKVLALMGDELGIKDVKTLHNVLTMRMTVDVSSADEIPPDAQDPPDHLEPGASSPRVPLRAQHAPRSKT